MKKFILIGMLTASSMLFASDIKTLEANLNSTDAHIADSARMSLQVLPDNAGEDALLKAFKTQKDMTVKSGIAYSLGKLQSKKAFRTLLAAAREDNIVALSSILAIASYQSKEALSALNSLKKTCKNNPRRLSVIELAISQAQGRLSDSQYFIKEVPSNFNELDENQKAQTIRKFAKSKAIKDFLIAESKKDQTQRFYIALVPALCHQGGLDSLEAVFELKAKVEGYQSPIFVEAISKIRDAGTDEYFVKKVKEKNMLAIEAVARRGSNQVEDSLLVFTKDSNEWIRSASFNALAAVGTTKALEKILKDIEVSDKNYIKDAIKSLPNIISRLSKEDAQKFKAITQKLSKNAKANNSVYERILTFFGD